MDMSGIACLPVTALCVVRYEDATLLLSGAGSSLAIHDAQASQFVYLKQQIFPCQAIHGITSCQVELDRARNLVRVVIWGGRLICTGLLYLQHGDSATHAITAKLELDEPLDVGDWILDVSLDITGSKAILVTTHNNLYELSTSASLSDIGQQPHFICSGPQTLLYSGKALLVRDDHWIIVSGTVFGEIVVWTCSKQEDLSWKARTRHTLLGHQGSVFGVGLSDLIHWQDSTWRLLASCSDDRTIRIWDVTDCDRDLPDTDDVETSGRETGFGDRSEPASHLAMAWGHFSRIWNVHFQSHPGFDKTDHLGLFSRGEDGVCQLWRLELSKLFAGDSSDTGILTPVSHDRHHAGKNMWSFVPAMLDGQCRVFSGGADGQIVARNFNLPEHDSENERSIPFSDIYKTVSPRLISCSNSDSYPDSRSWIASREMNFSLRQYLLFDHGDILATTDAGEVLLGNTHTLDQWSLVHPSKHHKPVTLCSNCGGGFAFFCEIDGSLFAYDIVNRRTSQYTCSLPAQAMWMQVVHVSELAQDGSISFCMLVNMFGKQSQFLTIEHNRTGYHVKQCSLHVPQGFMITSGTYNIQHKLLVCGSRTGALLVFRDVTDESTEASNSYFHCHVHCSDTVTSIIELSKSHQVEGKAILYYLSTGRDGTIACHRIVTDTDSYVTSLTTVHRSSPPIGPYIEGAYFLRLANSAPALIVYGFKSKDFVVWDETNQISKMVVNCGGAHRNWDYLATIGMGGASDAFVWTKASVLGTYQEELTDHQIIQYGGHGREIKALAVSPCSIPSATEAGREGRLIATGAEDTDIRLFRYMTPTGTHDKPSRPTLVSVLRGHMTGIQDLVFSACGRFLFSSGGSEEFFVWRLESVPVLGTGVVLIAKLEKNVLDLDARIMGFDVLRIVEHEHWNIEFTILLAYSNGKAKLVTFSHTNVENDASLSSANVEGKCSLDATFEHSTGTICLSQARILVHDAFKFSLTAATDGALRLLRYSDSNAQVVSHHIHQSNIAAMAVHDLGSGTELVITGGDDNSLGMTILGLRSGIKKPFMFATLVPDAHAAALTAVAILGIHGDVHEHVALIVSAGNDQRVKLWRVRVLRLGSVVIGEGCRTGEVQGVEPAAELEMLGEHWTDVADVSNVAILGYRNEEGSDRTQRPSLTVMVVGVGMQEIHLTIR